MNLAAALAAGERTLRVAERHVEAMLTRLFPQTATSAGWKGWKYTPPGGIDVYQVTASAGAVQQIYARGFVTVTLHDHRAERFLSCTCRTYERPVDPRAG